LLAVPAIFIAITSPFVGIPIKRFGRKPVLMAGVLLYGVFGLAPFFMEDLHAILVTRAGVGVAEAMLMTVGKALIGDYFTGERRQRWVGYQNAIDAALGTSMWFIGGLLATFGWRSPFLLYIVAIPLLIAVAFLIWEPQPAEDDDSAPAPSAGGFPWRRMSVVYGVTIFAGAVYFSYPTQIARAFTEMGVATPFLIGILTAIASLGTPLGALIFSRATSFSIPTMMAAGLALIGLPYMGIGLSDHPYMATAIGFFEQIGNGLVGAVLTMWCIRSLSFEHRGQGMGIWGTCLVSGIFISPLLFGFIERITGTVQSGFVIVGGVCSIAAVLIPLLIRRTMPPEVIEGVSKAKA
jgi:MFS family permease